MSALEELKKIQKQIEDLKFEIEYETEELATAQAAIDEKKKKVDLLEGQVSITVACLNEEKKAEQEAFNTLLVKFNAGGIVTEDDFKIYASERGTTTKEVFLEPETEKETTEDPQSSAA